MVMSYLEFFECKYHSTYIAHLREISCLLPGQEILVFTTGIYQLILLSCALYTQSKFVYCLLSATVIIEKLLFCHFLYIARWATRQELTLYVLSLVSLKPNVRRLLLSVSLLLIFPFQSAGHFSAWTIKVKQMNITQIINLNYNCYIAYDKTSVYLGFAFSDTLPSFAKHSWRD